MPWEGNLPGMQSFFEGWSSGRV